MLMIALASSSLLNLSEEGLLSKRALSHMCVLGLPEVHSGSENLEQ